MIMKYNASKSRFEVFTSYQEYLAGAVDTIKSARFRFEKQPVACWWTQDLDRAALLISCADDDAKARLAGIASTRDESLTLSRAEDADLSKLDLNLADLGLDPRPFQRAGIGYAMVRDTVLFGDEPGLGKTLQALATIHFKQSYPCVAVVPASLKINWKKEAIKVVPELREEGAIVILRGRAKPGEYIDPKAKLIIINYDILSSWVHVLKALGPRAVIADESHFWKNDKAQRTKAGKLLVEGVKERYLLSGTALVNRPEELKSQLEILGVISRFGGGWGYLQRYCGAKKVRVPIPGRGMTFVWQFKGATNTDELQRKLREHVMVRHLKEDVLTELPPRQHQCIELPANGLQYLVDEENEAEGRFAEHRARLEREKQEAIDSGNQDTFERAAMNLRKLFEAHFTEMAVLAHKVAVAKLPKVLEFCLELLEGEDKIVVFAHHHDVEAALEKAFTEAGIETVRLTGLESDKQKDAAVVAFQEGTARVFIGGLKAAGVGITLTKARRAVFAELDWTPGVMDQAGDRLHRIGQTDSVLLTYIVLEDSLDSKKVGMLVEKRAVLRAVLDNPLKDYTVEKSEPKPPEPPPPDLPPAHVLAHLHRMGVKLENIPF
jgi:SWI/SNF-related matrix-associated actin-dependent regulator 1 of chromatin subfamily A